MPRKLTILALLIVLLHISSALFLGTSTLGSLSGNALQTLACALAVASAVSASRRSAGLARPFWLLAAAGLAVWGVANLGWAYYEVILHREPPPGSLVRFLFGTESIFFAMALLLDPDKDSTALDTESALDFVQIAIVFFFLFVGFYYLPAARWDQQSAYLREITVESCEDVILAGLALLQMLRARSAYLRKLYFGFFVYQLAYTVCTGLADFAQVIKITPTGTLFDLAWSVPLLGLALWASHWPGDVVLEAPRPPRRKGFGDFVLTNFTFALAPLIVLLQVSQLDAGGRAVRFSLLGLSILCYATRLGLTNYRAARITETLQRHNRALDSAVNGIAIVDKAGMHTYSNASFAATMGFDDATSIVGRNWREIYAPEDVRLLETEIRQALQKNARWQGPANIHRRDGSALPIEMSITTLPDGGVVCVTRDVRAHRDAENARAQAEAKFQMLVEQVAAISYIAELGVHGEWLYVSPQVEAMFGFAPQEWLSDSRAWIRHVHPEDHKIVEDAEQASQRGERFQAEYRVIRKDGRVIWVSDTAVVVAGSGAHPVMEGIIVDITERKQLETQLQQARKMEAIGRLAGGIAHDFNNLLTIIKGYTELALKRPKITPELQTDVERIEDASERASALVRQLLAFSRRQVLQPKLIDLNTIVLGLDQLLRRLMDEGIQMTTIPGQNIGTIKADPAQMEQVIMNLVVNARDAMPKGGRLTIETSNVDLDEAYASEHVSVKAGRYIMLCVSDTGMGMTPETVAHIFEPFYSTKESGRGTGLGLSTVYGIVKQSGGYIWVYSEPGRGSSFKVYLPRVEQQAEKLAAPTVATGTQTGTETILLVEDQPQVCELALAALTEKGYTVLAASTATEAERLSAQHKGEIHLLLTDVILPSISGRELATRLTPAHPKMRVLYMSGYTFSIIAQGAHGQGGALEEGVAFLQKPFTPRALCEKVRECLDRGVPATNV